MDTSHRKGTYQIGVNNSYFLFGANNIKNNGVIGAINGRFNGALGASYEK